MTFCLLFLYLSGLAAYGQQPPPSPMPNPDKGPPLIKIGRSISLREELDRSEVEPRSKRFQMNIRFVRATYLQKDLAGGALKHQQYDWTYFPEAAITIL